MTTSNSDSITERIRFWEEQDKINQELIPRVIRQNQLLTKHIAEHDTLPEVAVNTISEPLPRRGRSRGSSTKQPWTAPERSLQSRLRPTSRKHWRIFERLYLKPKPNSASRPRAPLPKRRSTCNGSVSFGCIAPNSHRDFQATYSASKRNPGVAFTPCPESYWKLSFRSASIQQKGHFRQWPAYL